MKAIIVALLIALGYAPNLFRSDPVVNVTRWDCDCTSITSKEYEGTYQQKNQYVQNPMVNCADSVARFVTVSVTINDTISIPFEDLNSSAFEIPLMSYGFKIGDPIHIVIRHYVSGSPKMLNPEIY